MVFEPTITFDEALIQYVGQFGRGQWRIVALASAFFISNALGPLLWVFLCVDPIGNRSWQCTDPQDAACQAVWSSSTPNQGFCELSSDQWAWTKQDSLISRLNLVCSDAWKVQMTNSITFAGCFIGSGLFGALCDRFGRRMPMLIATAIMAVANFVSLAAPNYWFMAIARAIIGLGAAGQSLCVFLLCTEITGPSYRGLASIASLFCFTMGEFVLVGLGAILPNWRHLTIAAGAVNIATMLIYPVITESARWLLSQGKQIEALALLQDVASRNGSKLPNITLVSSKESDDVAPAVSYPDPVTPRAANKDIESSSGSSSSGKPVAQRMGLSALFSTTSQCIRCLVLCITWFSLLLVYYGISLGSGSLPGSVYLTFAMGAGAETAALLVSGLSVDRVGRHTVVCVGLIVNAAACLACANVANQTGQAVLAALGKFGCSAAQAVIGIYTAELFATPIRSTAMGIFSQAARCGSIAAPFLLMMGTQLAIKSSVFVPYMAFGAVSLLAGLLVLVLPETLGAPMPETMQDLQQLQSMFSAKPWRQGLRGIFAFITRTRAASAPADDSKATAGRSGAIMPIPKGGRGAGTDQRRSSHAIAIQTSPLTSPAAKQIKANVKISDDMKGGQQDAANNADLANVDADDVMVSVLLSPRIPTRVGLANVTARRQASLLSDQL